MIDLELKLGNLIEFKNEDQRWKRNVHKIRKNENEDYFDEYSVTNMEDFVRSVNNFQQKSEGSKSTHWTQLQ